MGLQTWCVLLLLHRIQCWRQNEAFSFIFKCFPVAPRIYDFACALQDYCLKPTHSTNTMFMVDRFLWYNHVPEAVIVLNANICSTWHACQVAEQCNSALNRIKCSVSRMKQVTFMFSVRLFLEM